MKKIILPISDNQCSKLRNGYKVNVMKKNISGGNIGVEVLVDAKKYNSFNKSLEKSKGFSVSLNKDEIEANKMQGSGLFGKMKKGIKKTIKKTKQVFNKSASVVKKGAEFYKKYLKDTIVGEQLRDAIYQGSNTAIEIAIQALYTNPYTAPYAPVIDELYETYGDVALEYAINEKSGLGLRMGGNGLKMGTGLKMGGCCPHCKKSMTGAGASGDGKDLFLLQDQNQKGLRARGRPRKHE